MKRPSGELNVKTGIPISLYFAFGTLLEFRRFWFYALFTVFLVI